MKTFSIIVITVGLVLTAIGCLNVLGYIKFQTVDVSPPTILYVYPADKGFYLASDIDEYVVYAQDVESTVTTASYADSFVTVTLTKTPYTQIKHRLTIYSEGIECKYPDVDFDGVVGDTDASIIRNTINSGTYNTLYDLNNDGVVNAQDAVLVGDFYGTVSFKAVAQYKYSKGKVSFAFSVSSVGGTTVESGQFTVEDYYLLKGKWYINNVAVNSSSLLSLKDNTITVKFVKDPSERISDNDIKVFVKYNNLSEEIPMVSACVWEKQLTLAHGTHRLVLEAYSVSEMYKNVLTVTVTIPLLEYSISGIMLTIAGLMLIIGGMLIEKKDENKISY